MKKRIIIIVVSTSILITLGLFSFLKKSAAEQPAPADKHAVSGPYKDEAPNLIYNLLFCDDLALFKEKAGKQNTYPFDILFAANSSVADLQRIVDDRDMDPRIKVLACNQMRAKGQTPNKKELFGVVVEIGLNNGLDVLASFNNGTARYINHTGKILVWETTTDEAANNITNKLFQNGRTIVDRTGPWDKPRRPYPTKDMVRITLLVSDGLYFGEGPASVMFSDSMAGPALANATQLLQYLTSKEVAK